MKMEMEARSKLVEQQKKKAKEELAVIMISNTPKDESSGINKEVGTSTDPLGDPKTLYQEKKQLEVEQAKEEA